MAGALALAGPSTRVVDLHGRLLMPGFVEAHTHPFLGAFLTSGGDLQVPTLADALGTIKSYAKANPTGAVRGFGWRVDMFGPGGPTRAHRPSVTTRSRCCGSTPTSSNAVGCRFGSSRRTR